MKNAFYFILKALFSFRSQDIQLSVFTFRRIEKMT